MRCSSRPVFAIAAVVAAFLVAGVARAQTTGTAGPTIAATSFIYPDRIVKGVDLGSSTRPQNLNPNGVSYADCIADMTLRFNVSVSGFSGQAIQVWATRAGDCATDVTRGVNNNAAQCWLVNAGNASVVQVTQNTITLDVRVQDLVGPQQQPPFPPALVHEGINACNAQPSFASVAMDIWFLPLSSGQYTGSGAYDYSIATDLVGPPAPTGSDSTTGGPTIADGDTLFVVNWNPNSDADTIGYDVYIDPIPSQAVDATPVSKAPQATLVCPDTGTLDATLDVPEGAPEAEVIDAPMDAVAEAVADDAATDAPVDAVAAVNDAAAASSFDAGCSMHASSSMNATPSTCGSTLLASAVVQDSGVTATEVVDDAGHVIDASVVNGPGGVSTIPSANLVGINSASGVTVSDKSLGRYTITGLMNGLPGYTVAVSAVDGFGNIGPPSIEACDYPAPVNDFWQLYGAAGGHAGGGFCALEAVGQPVGLPVVALTFGAAAFATARRRRKDRR